jgi:hypothetical protein
LVVAFGILTDEDVDAINAPITKEVINHVQKIKQLINIGRAKSSLQNYIKAKKKEMTDAQVTEVENLIKDIK